MEERNDKAGYPSLEQVGLALAILPGLIVAVRLVRVSYSDDATMRTLVQTVDIVPLVLGTLLPSIPTLLMIGLIFAIVRLRNLGPAARQGAYPYYAILITNGVIYALLLLPTPTAMYAAGTVFGIVLIEVVYQRRARRRGSEPLSFDLPQVVGPFLATVLLMPVFLSDRMWLPAEVVERRNGERLVAYILSSDDGGFTTLMIDSSRKVVRIPATEIRGREPCNLTRRNRPLFAYLGTDRSPSAMCPKSP